MKKKILNLFLFIIISISVFSQENNFEIDNDTVATESITDEEFLKENDSILSVNYHNTKKQTNQTNQTFANIEFGVFSARGVNLFVGSLKQINKWTYIGIGFGVRHYYQDITLFPIFANCKFGIPNKKNSPFLSVKGGYSPMLGRLFFNPKIGVNFKKTNDLSIDLAVGYEMQQIGITHYGSTTDNSIGVSIGILFNPNKNLSTKH